MPVEPAVSPHAPVPVVVEQPGAAVAVAARSYLLRPPRVPAVCSQVSGRPVESLGQGLVRESVREAQQRQQEIPWLWMDRVSASVAAGVVRLHNEHEGFGSAVGSGLRLQQQPLAGQGGEGCCCYSWWPAISAIGRGFRFLC